MRLRLSASDVFHHLVHGMIRRQGGRGNYGQFRIRLGPGLDVQALIQAWTQASQRMWPLRARVVGWNWAIPTDSRALPVARSNQLLDAAAMQDLRQGLGVREQARLTIASDGVLVTWRHALMDARGMQILLSQLAGGVREPWWQANYRGHPEIPARAAERGRAAQATIPLLRPDRLAPLLRPAGMRGNAAAPIHTHSMVLGAHTEHVDARIRSTVGRFGETAFLLAAVAAALAEQSPENSTGNVLFPLAADCRKPHETRSLANAHGFVFLSVPGELARRDLRAAAVHLRDAHKAWIGANGTRALMSSISWMPLLGTRLARNQIGFGHAGLHASACVANAGRSLLTGPWFGAAIQGIDHTATVPGHPGVAVLFHRDDRGLAWDTVITGRLARRLPPAVLAERIRWHLVERPLAP